MEPATRYRRQDRMQNRSCSPRKSVSPDHAAFVASLRRSVSPVNRFLCRAASRSPKAPSRQPSPSLQSPQQPHAATKKSSPIRTRSPSSRAPSRPRVGCASCSACPVTISTGTSPRRVSEGRCFVQSRPRPTCTASLWRLGATVEIEASRCRQDEADPCCGPTLDLRQGEGRTAGHWYPPHPASSGDPAALILRMVAPFSRPLDNSDSDSEPTLHPDTTVPPRLCNCSQGVACTL